MIRIKLSSILHLAGKVDMNKNESDIGNSKAEKPAHRRLMAT